MGWKWESRWERGKSGERGVRRRCHKCGVCIGTRVGDVGRWGNKWGCRPPCRRQLQATGPATRAPRPARPPDGLYIILLFYILNNNKDFLISPPPRPPARLYILFYYLILYYILNNNNNFFIPADWESVVVPRTMPF